MSVSIPSTRFFVRKKGFNLIDFNLGDSSFRGQSAIEYLMTYGWMLLVVAVVGGAVFSIVQGESIDSISGFAGSDVIVDEAGLTTNNNVQMILRNGDSNSIDIKKVTISDGSREAYYKPFGVKSIGVGETGSVSVNGIVDSGGSNNLDVKITYDTGALENLQASGSISGSLALEAGKPVSLESPSVGGDWTWVDGNSYFETDSNSEEGFYVMTYEARNDSGDAISQPEGQPWVGEYGGGGLNFNDAYDECQNLGSQSSDYDIHLITNREWMTIARQVENQKQNWVDGDIGSSLDDDKGMVRGWSAGNQTVNYENTAYADDSTVSNLYNVDEDQGSSTGNDLLRRTHVLGSGDIIWDFVGNVHNMVDVQENGTGFDQANISADGSSGFIEDSTNYNSPWGFNNVEDEKYELGSSNNEYDLYQNLGSYSDSGGSDQIAIRGGVFNDFYRAGPYRITTTLSPSEGQSATGFRCTAVPN